MNGNLHRIRREAGFRTAEELARSFGLDEKKYTKLERETDRLPTVCTWGDHMDIRTVNELAELYRVPAAAVIGAEDMAEEDIRAAAESAKHVLRFVEKVRAGARGVNEQVARHVDAKGNVVLGRFGDDAVVFRGGETEPFAAAAGYDEKTGEWLDVTFCETAAEAWDRADPNVLDDWETLWTREDVAEALEGRGYFPTDDFIDKTVDEIKARGGLSGIPTADGWDVISEAIGALEDGVLWPRLAEDGLEVANRLTGTWALGAGDDGGPIVLNNPPRSTLDGETKMIFLYEVGFDPYEGAVWKKDEMCLAVDLAAAPLDSASKLSPAEVAYLFGGTPEHQVGEFPAADRLREVAVRRDLLKPNVEAWLDDLDENAKRETPLPEEEVPVQAKGGEAL